MAVDEALMASARSGFITLRLYRWDPPCLSLGRNQSGEFPTRGRPGLDVVRRPTGGRAVYHHRELTYSVTLPERAWGGPRATYALINRALARGLAGLGVPVVLAESKAGDPSPATPRPCFSDPAPGELIARGRKLVGSAQWRHDNALLQHGSLLLKDDQRKAVPGGTSNEVISESPDSGIEASTAIGLGELLPGLPTFDGLVEAVRNGFETELGVATLSVELSPTERRAASELEPVYGGPEWTWNRRRLPSYRPAS